jgi:Lipase (class 2)
VPAVADLLPAVSPSGANDFTCRPDSAHPAPVVLVHGTFEGAFDNWATVSPAIKAAGYCVFALEYGDRGTGDIAASAAQLDRFVDAVLGATGAQRVSLLGHSQGGMMPRHYIKFLGGGRTVDDLIGLAPSNHGTTNPGAFVAGATFCPACDQQRAGSGVLHRHPDPLRRGRHAVHLGVPRRRRQHGERPPPGRLSCRGDRPPLHAAQRAGDPLGAPGARTARAGRSSGAAPLHLTGDRRRGRRTWPRTAT